MKAGFLELSFSISESHFQHGNKVFRKIWIVSFYRSKFFQGLCWGIIGTTYHLLLNYFSCFWISQNIIWPAHISFSRKRNQKYISRLFFKKKVQKHSYFIYLLIYLPIYLFIYLSIYLFIYLFICLFIYLFNYLNFI